tara:strand:- start:295 stop:501 length:207 start_codon:yes stop_codon:yes gene_type:complete
MSAGGKNKDNAGRQMSPSQSRKEREHKKSKEMEQEFLGQMQKLANKLNAQLTVADEIIDKKLKNKLLH